LFWVLLHEGDYYSQIGDTVMIISTGTLSQNSLLDKIAIVSGAGGGIGYEAVRSLIWMGAKAVIAEISKSSGKQAEARLNAEFGDGSALFVHTDVGDERSILRLKRKVFSKYNQVDIVINNATVAPLGAVKDVPIQEWDSSYNVNLRGPVLFARAFIPEMVERASGVFMCVSSLGQEYMAAYEAIKAAQVHLGSTLAAELEGTGVIAFTIGPGYVPTKTAEESIPKLAKMMRKSAEELFEIVKEFEISVGAAGAGFAAAAALAHLYSGQEISSTQALIDAGIGLPDPGQPSEKQNLSEEQMAASLDVCRTVRTTLAEQYAGWKDRSVFEQQWLKRTFRSRCGMPVEGWLEALKRLEDALANGDLEAVAEIEISLVKLAGYYDYLHGMGKGYIKDPIQRKEHLGIVRSWKADVERLERLLTPEA
jgi:NAD(P)-dependent dehydrogenase (short-subunit alcohol dehydrogenase family)